MTYFQARRHISIYTYTCSIFYIWHWMISESINIKYSKYLYRYIVVFIPMWSTIFLEKCCKCFLHMNILHKITSESINIKIYALKYLHLCGQLCLLEEGWRGTIREGWYRDAGSPLLYLRKVDAETIGDWKMEWSYQVTHTSFNIIL